MIPRYQRIVFWTLCALTVMMAAFTIHERQKAHDRVTASTDAMPFIQPVDAQSESVPLFLANDSDGSIISGLRETALPSEPSLRAHALIERLMAEYGLPNSPHPLKAGAAVEDVFLLKPPGDTQAPAPGEPENLLAVVNLRSTFAENHPSSIRIETLTIASIVGTLHANLPQITQIRFLVDGLPRETLAGHADLLRTYAAVDTSIQHTQPLESAE